VRPIFAIFLLIFSIAFGQQGKSVQIRSSDKQDPSNRPIAASRAGSSEDIREASSCAGDDIGAKINACIATLPKASDGHRTGTIMLPNTIERPELASWTTEVHMSSGVNLIGRGSGISQFTCTAPVCLFMDEHERQGGKTEFSFAPERSDTWSDFTINGANLPNQEIIRMWDRNNLTMTHIHVDNSNGPGGSCLHLESHSYWTERNVFQDITTLYSCRIAWRLTNESSNPNALPSFGFNRFLDIRMNPTDGDGFGQRGFSIEDKVYFYNSFIRLIANAAGPKYSELFHLQDEGKVFYNTLNVDGEGGLKYIINLASPTTGFTYYGHVNLFGNAYHVTPGAFLTHYGDDGGNGPSIPLKAANGIESLRAIPLSPGTNLDSVSSCGSFFGTNLRNAPAESGTHIVSIQTVCTGEPNLSLLQIAYETANTQAKPRVWQRVKDAGKWGTWREQAWADQQWNSIPAANHVVCIKNAGPPVSLGYCSTRPDASGACSCN
jgi:hypothetical protein